MNEILVTIWDYPLSYLELVGTLAGLLCVWLAVKNNILTWPIGLINVIAFFVLFYQLRLYSDMLLQVYFFLMSLYGWWHWRKADRKPEEEPIKVLSNATRLWLGLGLIAGIIALSSLMARIHIWLPDWFPEPAAYPVADAFTTVLSIAATLLLARRVLENWILWILVDLVAVIIYFAKDIRLVAIEYLIFLFLATSGLIHWYKTWKK